MSTLHAYYYAQLVVKYIWNCYQLLRETNMTLILLFYCSSWQHLYLWFIISQLLDGLSSLLVSMSVFEFICAQVPPILSILIGCSLVCGMLPSAMGIYTYLVVGMLNNLVTEKRVWLICEGFSGETPETPSQIMVLFLFVSLHYCHWQRDEIVIFLSAVN